MNYIIASNTNFLENLTALQSDKIHLIDHHELQKKQIPLTLENKIYAPHEDALSAIITQSQDTLLTDGIVQLKDKYLFRQLLQKSNPNYYCKVINRLHLETLKLPPNKKFVLKPRRGFFGTAVHFIDADTDLTALCHTIEQELGTNAEYFSDTTLSVNEMIVEEFIEGEEYAVDMFYNSNGEAVITNITHHPLPHKQAYFHSIYYTSQQIFNDFYLPFLEFFNDFNQQLKLKNFPLHAEFKGTPQHFAPIEMNPLRFGGFGLADLTLHMSGVNPFKLFFSDESFNWSNFWKKDSNIYAWVLGYNGTEIDVKHTLPQHQDFKQHLGEILHYIAIDHLNNPVFALAYTKLDNLDQVHKIKDLEFNNFFIEQ